MGGDRRDEVGIKREEKKEGEKKKGGARDPE